MKLKTLLQAHQKYSKQKGVLVKNLGDGYLLAHNPIYRVVRTEASRLGFKFTSKRFRDYDSLALTQLPVILTKKTAPYCDNVRPLLEIEKADPGFFDFSDVPAIRPNQVFHECAHGIAHHLVQKHIPLTKKSTPRERVLHLLFQEAYANACESVSNHFAVTELHDEFLYKNSYIMEETPEREVLAHSVRAIGLRRTFEFVLLSFLYANFIATNQGEKNFSRVAAVVFRDGKPSLKKSDLAVLKKLMRIGFDLDQDFTIFTNGFIFKRMGLRESMPKLLGFDFLRTFEIDSRATDCLSAMSSLFASKT